MQEATGTSMQTSGTLDITKACLDGGLLLAASAPECSEVLLMESLKASLQYELTVVMRDLGDPAELLASPYAKSPLKVPLFFSNGWGDSSELGT